jgi:hypothetical protein
VKALPGLERKDLPSGDRYLKLHHYADPDKDAAWLEGVRREMSGTPSQFKQQILMMDQQSEGALWSNEWFELEGFRLPRAIGRGPKTKTKEGKEVPGKLVFRPPVELERIVVAIDPAGADPERRKRTDKETDPCGVVVAGLTPSGRFIVLGDFTERMAPGTWARLAVELYGLCGANLIVAEQYAGDMVREMIRSVATNVPVKIETASAGKRARAEPVAAIYENGLASHCGPQDGLEGEMVTWDALDGSPSPNRIDATCWAAHALGLCVITGRKPISRLKRNNLP